MSDTLNSLIEHYGLIAVFLACLSEGETAALLAGFFSHQGVFVPWQAFFATWLGAFGGDTMFFLTGRYFAEHRFVRYVRGKPGFSHAYALVQSHPNTFVFTNRFIYGMRLVGGVVAGLSNLAFGRFVIVNAVSSLLWTAIFTGMGYFFGLGAERLLGDALQKHERLLAALVLAAMALAVAFFLVRRWVHARYAPQELKS
jgi:membrane protein DedA with SNARE-associated domain